MNNRLKTLIFSVLAIIFIILMTIMSFSLSGKVKEAETKAENADSAAAAYATALAESNEQIDSVKKALSESIQKEKEMENEEPPADQTDEASLYADFTAGDSAIRRALNALDQDESELVKNFRIRVSLEKMEDVPLPGGEGKRVRFTGSFNPMSSRKNAVIRISALEGSFKGKIYISGLRFNDEENIDLSALTAEDVETSHGSALISAGTADLNGNGCISLNTDFKGTGENESVSVMIPLKTLNSAEFTKVYYDLYFDGEPSSFSFTTGCDFSGRDDISVFLDDINRAFILYRGKTAAGQEDASLNDLEAAVSAMKSALKTYPETDPLVIIINERLDEKLALANGSMPEESAENASPASPAESTANTGVSDSKSSAPVSYSPVTGESSDSRLPLTLALIFAFLSIVSVLLLSLSGRSASYAGSGSEATSSGESENPAEKYSSTRNTGNRAAESTEPSESDPTPAEETVLLKTRISELETALENAKEPDLSGLQLNIDRSKESLNALEEALSALIRSAGDQTSGEEAMKARLKELARNFEALTRANEELSSGVATAKEQLAETSTSVKDISQAATIISDVASETNLL
ncbi:MAG: hypothetical protein IJ857_04605, partial [Lachnospiraceae bacterium]|nr:hypothetical protein [Lachnospiraceae bacterium]